MISLREAKPSDQDRIWEIFHAVVTTGDTYAFSPETSRDEALKYWMSKDVKTIVAEDQGRVVGTYIIKPNQTGLGSHVANGSFMVDPESKSKGVGFQMGEDALKRAKALGYQAMQFNFVISTNERAVALWKRLGFNIIGTSPRAYRHATLGLVDAYIMHRFLE